LLCLAGEEEDVESSFPLICFLKKTVDCSCDESNGEKEDSGEIRHRHNIASKVTLRTMQIKI